MKHLLRQGWLLVCIAAAGAAFAQSKFTINGRVKVDGGSLDGCRMVVYLEGEKHRVVSSNLNRFSLDLELNKNYVLSFEKDGFVTKKLMFNTTAPGTAGQSGFSPFDFVVSLFKQYEGVNTVVFNQPVGMIRYNEVMGDFDYDTDYTKSIQSALETAQAEVDRKQKEEASKNEQAEKQKQLQAKEQAKAEAQAAKEAADRQKAQAKAEAQAAKESAAQKAKQEAATRRAPQEQVLAKQAAPPPPPPPPPPAPEAPPRKAPPQAPPPRVAHASVLPQPATSVEARRSTSPRMMEEPSRMQPAKARSMEEPKPKFVPTPVVVVRQKDVIVTPNEVVTVIKVERGEVTTEYRRVARKYSGVFFFKDGRSCSQLIYEREALAEN